MSFQKYFMQIPLKDLCLSVAIVMDRCVRVCVCISVRVDEVCMWMGDVCIQCVCVCKVRVCMRVYIQCAYVCVYVCVRARGCVCVCVCEVCV